MNDHSLDTKVAIVTGGGSGIGRAIARTLALHGAIVHIIDRNENEGQKVVNEIMQQKGTSSFHACDVSQNGEVRPVIESIAESNGIDILVNNAGIAHVGTIEKTTEEDLDRLYQVNIKGVYNCSSAVIPIMKKKQNG